MFAAAMEAAPVEAPKPGARLQRAALPKSQRKFQRYDREPGAPAADPAPESQPAEGRATTETTAAPLADEEERPSAPTSKPVPIALTGGASNRRARPLEERNPHFWLWLQGGAFALILLGYLLGRATAPKVPATVGKAAPRLVDEGSTVDVLKPEAAKLIDQAMAVEQDRKFAEASELLLKVQREQPHVRDLNFRLAMLAIESGDYTKAMPLLNLSISEGEQIGAAYRMRGTLLNRRGGINRGANDFENATLVDPFDAENYYFWGEALRKAGKPQAALVKLQQAIDRLRQPELETQYRLKVRLVQIELGREQEFAQEMAERLAENPPRPDWLMTAAGVELHRGNAEAAAKYLDKAVIYMEKDLFTMVLRDYYFYSFRFQKPVARFFAFAAAPAAPTPTPAASPTPGPLTGLPDATSLLQGQPAPSPEALPTGMP